MQNPVMYALPMFAVVIAIEAVELRNDQRTQTGYVKGDTRSSILMGFGSLAFLLIFKIVTLLLFSLVWVEFAPWHLPTDAWWTWVALFLAVDLTWYLNHRFSHRVRIGWAGHRAHHSSETFNFSSAVRLKWNPWSEAIFWLPLPLMGFAPWTIYVAYGFNMIYQFFLHTELVGTLPRPIEYVFNTPAHHRIHHSRRREHLDKNYGGMFVIWDRVFGTVVDGDCYPEYGLYRGGSAAAPTDPPVDDGILQLQYGEYGRILADVRRTRNWRRRLGYVFAPPGWSPSEPASAVPSERRVANRATT